MRGDFEWYTKCAAFQAPLGIFSCWCRFFRVEAKFLLACPEVGDLHPEPVAVLAEINILGDLNEPLSSKILPYMPIWPFSKAFPEKITRKAYGGLSTHRSPSKDLKSLIKKQIPRSSNA